MNFFIVEYVYVSLSVIYVDQLEAIHHASLFVL